MPATMPIKIHISINNVRFGNRHTNRLILISIFDIILIHSYLCIARYKNSTNSMTEIGVGLSSTNKPIEIHVAKLTFPSSRINT